MITEENKKEYVKLLCNALMADCIREQIQAFLEGFRQLIPLELISIFDSRELELMISGLPEINSNFEFN